MADTSGPWNNATWSEGQWGDHIGATMISGVIGDPVSSAGTGALGLTTSGLTVTLAVGSANVGGFGYDRVAPVTSTAVTANTNATNNRRDRLVLRRNLSTQTITPVVIAGAAAASPVAPAITRSATVFDQPMFSFLVPPASGTNITGIVDERIFVSGSRPNRLAVWSFANLPTEGLYAGMMVVDASNGDTWRYDGSAWVVSSPRMMRAQRTPTGTIPSAAYTSFTSDTGWTETDPWNMRSTGATFVANWTGWYQINATVYFAADGTGARGIALEPAAGVDVGNGSGTQLRLALVPAATSNSTIVSGSHLTQLNAGNTVQLSAYQNSGGSLAVENINISMTYLGRN